MIDVCTGSEGVSDYFVLIETINLLMQWWEDKLKSNKLMLFDLSLYVFYYFIGKLMVPSNFFYDLIYPVEEKFL